MKKFEPRARALRVVAAVIGSAVLVLGGAAGASADTRWDAVPPTPAATEIAPVPTVLGDTQWT